MDKKRASTNGQPLKNTQLNHTPRLAEKPVNKLAAYEALRRQLMAECESENDLLQACQQAAKALRLPLIGGRHV